MHDVLSRAQSLESMLQYSEKDKVTYGVSSGECVGSSLMHINKIAVQKSVLGKGTELRAHIHENEEEVLVIYEGDLTVVFENDFGGLRKITVINNGVVVIPPNTSHLVTSENGCLLVGVTVPASSGYPKN